MQIHQIKREHPNKSKKLVGRGGTRGKTAGRGTKGQKARAGAKLRPALRDTIKKLPKLRGYKNKAFRIKPTGVNLKSINVVATDGMIVNPITLLEMGLIKMSKGRMPKVKILGLGDITKKVTISGCEFSAAVKEKVEAAGGTIA
jgi:large subunit ribosomal protein L15